MVPFTVVRSISRRSVEGKSVRAWVERTIREAKARFGEEVWAQEYQAGQAFVKRNGLTMEQAVALASEHRDG